MNRFPLRNLSLLALAMVATSGLVAQDSTGQIVGTVRLKSGEPVAGASVRITGPALQGARVVVTNADGSFRAPLLPPGQGYTITTSKAGYVGGKVENISLGLGQTMRQDLGMALVQAATATVEVIAGAATVDKSDVKTATNVSAEMLDVLPRLRRGMDTAALLAPGVSANAAMGNRIMIRGGNTTSNRFMLNGTDISDNVFGDTNGRGYYVDDSIAETQVISSPVNAKFGGFTGGVMNAITKSGSNNFEGTIRLNLTRNSWTAMAPPGLRPNGAQPNPGTDLMNREYTVWLGGPIIKDALWFSASTKLDPILLTANSLSNVAGLTTGDGSGSAAWVPATNAGAFNTSSANQFYELKLTWAINANHTLEAAGNRNVTDQVNRFYIASPDPRTLVPQTNINEYQTLGYRGIFGSNLTVEARYAYKQQSLSAGADISNGEPIRVRYSNGTYYQTNNGIFNKNDGGDKRDIKTYTAAVTWYSPKTFLGTHTVEGGFEILNQARASANSQSPTDRQFFVWGRNADATYRVAGAATSLTAYSQNYVALYDVDRGMAKTDISAFFLNDTVAITDRWQVMAGVRYDKTEASDTLGSTTISSSILSPRFQLRWDLFGDQSWIATASWARYAGKLGDGFTNRLTRAGAPITETFGWAGARNDAISIADLTNLANWNISGANLRSYSGPLARKGDPNTKAPNSDEISLGLRHTYSDGSYIGLNYAQRSTKDFFNDIYTIGDEVNVNLVSTPGTTRAIMERWATDSRLKREFNSFEFEFNFRFGPKWLLGGNYTLASLTGNSEGSEGNNPPVSGDVTADFESVHTTRGRDWSYFAPDGYLGGDIKHRANIYLNYQTRSASGLAFNASLLYNYQGGSPYSITRANLFEAQADATAAGSTIASQYGSFASYTRYFGQRGIGRFNDISNFDLKLGTEVPLAYKVRYFLELTVSNIFNHWQLRSFDTTGVSGAAIATGAANSGYVVAARTGVATGNQQGWGTYGFGNYSGGRSVAISTGVKW